MHMRGGSSPHLQRVALDTPEQKTIRGMAAL
ncbi:hypothetical protein BN1079_01839 [Pseudomonas saudiphocaensis]|jgi:hypothetical protein|uniref:Uncharacterized protein n=1 Tax=Pseudomonas saudiphocaensis TaxID=1499686 RepID=A0A078LXB2_9PSED|nr:hypothetical protein BN1079_01839 [Pseudomonas saudiphocaensis]